MSSLCFAEKAAARHMLIFQAGALGALRTGLLEDAPLESACFLLARPIRTPAGTWRLIVHDSIPVAPEEYARRTATEIDLPPEVVARVLQRARASGSSIVVTHSHPGAEVLAPSPRDLAGEAQLVPTLARRIPGVPHVRLIVGPTSLHAALFDPDGTVHPLSSWEVGPDLFPLDDDQIVGLNGTGPTYDRQVRAFGEEGQHRLARLRVAIIGLGGTGSVVAQQLAHLGVGSFLLVDPDALEVSNLNRVVGTSAADVGRPKVEIAREMIMEINPGARVVARQEDVRDASTVRRVLDCDLFLSCTDSHGSRAVLTQLAYQYHVPGIDVGVAIQATPAGISHISGRVQMLAPGLPCLLCAGVLDPETVRRDLLTDEARAADPYIVGAATPQPAVISINSTASSLAVTMLLAAVTGIPVAARHQRLRLETGVVTRVDTTAQPQCPICSPAGALGRGDTWPTPGRQG